MTIMFLTDIHFKRQLSVDNSKYFDCIFQSIQEKLSLLNVNQINFKNNRIDFKNSFFNGQGNWHLIATVDKAYFDYNKVTSVMTYSISTLRVFVFAFVASCIFALLDSSVYTGLFAFLWLYGMNWIISTIRHNRFFNKLMDEVETKNYNIKHNELIATKQL